MTQSCAMRPHTSTSTYAAPKPAPNPNPVYNPLSEPLLPHQGPQKHDPRPSHPGVKPGAMPASWEAEARSCCPGTCFFGGRRQTSCSKAAAEGGLGGL